MSLLKTGSTLVFREFPFTELDFMRRFSTQKPGSGFYLTYIFLIEYRNCVFGTKPMIFLLNEILVLFCFKCWRIQLIISLLSL
jgi:hypothetical protein